MQSIKNLYNKLFQYELTQDEKEVVDIVSSIIDEPDTDKIMSSNGKCYFSNKKNKIQICFDGTFVTILKQDNCFEYHCTGKFASYLDRLICNRIERGIKGIESTIYDAKLNILNKMK